MRGILLAAALSVATVPVLAADVGVSISVGEPGFYGRINIGDVPEPEVIYADPVIVYRQPSSVFRQPIYLRVPPGHEKHWRKHCHEYAACGRPVYFVRDMWYERTYASRHQEHERNSIGVSVSIGEPGFYGRIDIGDAPEPEVIYADPVIVYRRLFSGSPQPIYLRVPSGYERHWQEHCHEYDACSRPVYFVKDKWYERTYVSRYHKHGHERHGKKHGRHHRE